MWPPQQALFRKQLRRGRLAQLSNPKIFCRFSQFSSDIFSYFNSFLLLRESWLGIWHRHSEVAFCYVLQVRVITTLGHVDHRLLRTTKALQTLRSQLLADFSKCTQTSKFSPNDTTERYLHGVWEKQNGIQFCSPGPDLVGNVFATQFKFFFSRTFEHDL